MIRYPRVRTHEQRGRRHRCRQARVRNRPTGVVTSAGTDESFATNAIVPAPLSRADVAFGADARRSLDARKARISPTIASPLTPTSPTSAYSRFFPVDGGFASFGRLATGIGVTRPIVIHPFRDLGSRRRHPGGPFPSPGLLQTATFRGLHCFPPPTRD